MPSLGSILSIATSGLRASQAAIGVTAHNIANAETEGYSRQRAVLGEGYPITLPQGIFGTGVQVLDVERARDEFSNAAVRREFSLMNGFTARQEFLGRVEALLQEPGDLGLSAGLDRFFSAWSELATHPGSLSARTALRAEAEGLADRFRTLSAGLDQLRHGAGERLSGAVVRINEIAGGVAELNRRIVAAEAGAATAGDLRDARDRLLDELAGLTPVTVVHRSDGSVGVLSSGISLVDGATVSTVEVREVGGSTGLGLVGRPGLLPDAGGTTGGLLELLNEDLPRLRQGIDALVAALVEEVNTLHRSGTNAAGGTGIDFFDPGGATAGTLRLSSAVLADAASIVAGTDDGAGAPRPGANDVALALAGLRDRALGATGQVPGASVRALVSQVGNALRSAVERGAVHRVLADRATLQRESLSGVSTDEEMTRLIRFQAAYAAAARVVTVADEMMEALLRM